MKSINEYIVNESKTRLQDIENYGKSWVGEWGVEFFGNVLSSFIKGAKKGLEENKQYCDDDKFIKRCSDFINRIEEEVNKEIY